MKAKIITFVLVVVFSLSLVACGETDIQSVLDIENTEEIVIEEAQEVEIPEAVVNISEQDDQALTGTLTEDSYTNPYFGLKFNKPEGGILEDALNEGPDFVPFSQTYAKGIGGIYINIRNDDGSLSPAFVALSEEEKGKTEEDFIQEAIDIEAKMNELMEGDSEFSVETVSIAGEEHPAYIEVYTYEGEVRKNASVYILKGDFKCNIFISALQDRFDEMLGLIEKYQ